MLAMIYLFYGADDYSIKQAIDEIAKKFPEKIIIDKDHPDYETYLSQPTLFGEEPLLVFRNFLPKSSKSEQEKLKETLAHYVKDKSGQNIIFWEGKKLDKRLNLVKWFLLNVEIKEFKPLSLVKVREWVERKVETCHGMSLRKKTENKLTPKLITPGALEELIRRHGSNLWALDSEIRKLTTYGHNRTITLDDVKLMCSSTTEENIFAFTDAIGNKNKTTTAKLFQNLIKQNHDPWYLFAMIVRQFRLLLLMKSSGKSRNLHPFVAKKIKQQTQHWKLEELKKIYQKLLDIEVACKKGMRDLETELALFIARL